MTKPILSKSTFLRGLQCLKNLYLYKNHYHLKDAISASQQAIFDQGTDVGALAQNLFPNGVDASPPDHFRLQESVAKTKSFIENGETVIYEATFQHNDVIAAIDILVKDENGWTAFEVKSSTEVKDVHIADAAIQYYTIVNSSIVLNDIAIVHINNQYVKQGRININELFTIASVYEKVQSLVIEIPGQIDLFKKVIRQNTEPEIDIGPHCDDPYTCDFKGHCWKHIPDYSIFNIAR
ncbi:MAG: DUF2779 domain-containing protein, partial [Acidimicrobiia bacterium]|nr:DUF2779 domain-containing protein [Acidimicrobiia bacterium]